MLKLLVKDDSFMGFPGDSDGKESACNAGDLGLIPGLGRSSEEGNGYPLQYSCLENSVDGVAWWATYRTRCYKESDTTECLSTQEIKKYKLMYKINKLGQSILQQRECGQDFIITIKKKYNL